VLITRVTKARRQSAVPVVIAEHDAKRRVRLSGGLEEVESVEVVGQAGDVATAVSLAAENERGVVVIGASVSHQEALTMLERLRGEAPDVRSLIVRDDPEDEGHQELLLAGASGVVAADSPPDSIADVIERVARGEAVVGPRLKVALLERFRRATASRRGMRPLLGPLSTREWQVLDLLRGGASTDETAAQLGIARATVYSHLRNIARKLGTEGREEAIAFADALRMRGSSGTASQNGD
jgi:DNA-binding NarL/FixJ family response regulator